MGEERLRWGHLFNTGQKEPRWPVWHLGKESNRILHARTFCCRFWLLFYFWNIYFFVHLFHLFIYSIKPLITNHELNFICTFFGKVYVLTFYSFLNNLFKSCKIVKCVFCSIVYKNHTLLLRFHLILSCASLALSCQRTLTHVLITPPVAERSSVIRN